MKTCPECSGKVPETYEECPFCGCLFAKISEETASSVAADKTSFSEEEEDSLIDCFSENRDPGEDTDEDSSNNEPLKPVRSVEHSSDESSGNGVKRWLLELLLFLLALLVAGVIVIATDFKGCRTELRRICMTDSGDASKGDQNLLRVKVKHYILVCLDLIDHGGTGSSVRTNSNAFDKSGTPVKSKIKTEEKIPSVSPEKEALPKAPPEVEDLDSSLKNTQPADKIKKDAQATPEGLTDHESR